jgi:hypothetical protein
MGAADVLHGITTKFEMNRRIKLAERRDRTPRPIIVDVPICLRRRHRKAAAGRGGRAAAFDETMVWILEV